MKYTMTADEMRAYPKTRMHHRFAGVDYFNGHSEVWRQRFPPLYTMTAVLYLRRISFYVQLRTRFVPHWRVLFLLRALDVLSISEA